MWLWLWLWKRKLSVVSWNESFNSLSLFSVSRSKTNFMKFSWITKRFNWILYYDCSTISLVFLSSTLPFFFETFRVFFSFDNALFIKCTLNLFSKGYCSPQFIFHETYSSKAQLEQITRPNQMLEKFWWVIRNLINASNLRWVFFSYFDDSSH